MNYMAKNFYESSMDFRYDALRTSSPIGVDMYQEYESNALRTYYFFGDDVILDASRSPWGDKHLVVFAESVTIRGLIKNPGNKIFIVANRVVSENGELNTSGTDGQKWQNIPAPVYGYKPDGSGLDGSTGEPGRAGQNGGDILVYTYQVTGALKLCANGGAGSKGQKGGDGAKGRVGDTGADASIPRNHDFSSISGEPGGKGKRGGDSGKGGDGGTGGNSGLVYLYVNDSSSLTVVFETQGGSEGQPGDYGAIGSGGDPGSGGHGLYWRRHPDGRSYIGPLQGYRNSNNGGIGDSGGYPLPAPVYGLRGQSTPAVSRTNIQLLNQLISWSYLQALVNQVQTHYWSGQHSNCARLLGWLYRISSNEGSQTSDTLNGFYPLINDPLADFEKLPLHELSRTYIQYMRSGFDLDGRPLNYVPLVSFEFYNQSVSRLLSDFREIEENYQRYLDTSILEEARRDAVEANLQLTAAKLSKYEEELRSIQDEINKLTNAGGLISKLTNQIDFYYKEIIRSEDSFKQAISRQANCDFIDVLKAAAAIVIMPGLTIGTIKSTIEAANAISKISEFEQLVKKIEPVFEGLDKISQAYAKLIKYISNVTEVKAQIAVTYEKFEEELKPYLDKIPEAKEYRDTIKAYLSTCDTKNKKIQELMSFKLKEVELINDIQSTNFLIQKLRTESATATNLLTPVLLNGSKNIYWGMKIYLLKQMNMMSRALEYWYLNVRSTPLQLTYNHAFLLNSFNRILADAQNFRNNAQGLFNGFDKSYKVIISNDQNQNLYNSFMKNGSFVMDLDFPEIAQQSGGPVLGLQTSVGILITGIDVLLKSRRNGLKNKEVSIKVIHSGVERLRNWTNGYSVYSRIPSGTLVTKRYGSGRDVTSLTNVQLNLTSEIDSENYSYRSLYSSYYVVIADPSGIVKPSWLSSIKSIEISFTGFQRTRI
jgi:hypothetical protein